MALYSIQRNKYRWGTKVPNKPSPKLHNLRSYSVQHCITIGNTMNRIRRFLSQGDHFKSSPTWQTVTQNHYDLKVFDMK